MKAIQGSISRLMGAAAISFVITLIIGQGLGVFLLVTVALFALLTFAERSMLRDQDAALRALVEKHADTLALKRLQKLRMDDYGNVVDQPWKAEVKYFFDTVITPAVKPGWPKPVTLPDIEKLVDDVVRSHGHEGEQPRPDVSTMSPVEYERFCVSLIQEAGWEARTTPGSGDQGVDIIAIRGSSKAVVQCKLYSTPVGNKAVQEIIAGRVYNRAEHAIVVSNATFTPSAHELAGAADVKLVSHLELRQVIERLGELVADS